MIDAFRTLIAHAEETYPHFESPRVQADIARALAAVETARELLEACRAIAALADGQGRLNMLEVAGQARQAIAKAE